MKNNKIKCSIVEVNCVLNDPVDVRCGGPYYLGFDFFVKREETEDMINFIEATLNEFNVPLIGICSYNREIEELNNIWTKEKIYDCIKNDANYLKSEANRNYSYKLH